MAANQKECFRFEQRSLIKFLVAETSKPSENYRTMWDVKHILVTNVRNSQGINNNNKSGENVLDFKQQALLTNLED